ncbi:MAG TPA: MraY family glycosyltransferase [Coriobacteriia bacterium]|nr:MraY family glycosyltransferase [Coriobacteriia bacterium]
MTFVQYGMIIAVAAVVTLLVTPLVRVICVHYGLVDKPSRRKVHSTPIPRLGGVAIFAGLVAAVAFGVVAKSRLGWPLTLFGTAERTNMPMVFAGVALIFAVGLVDDIWDIPAGWKLAGQVLAALVVAQAGLLIEFVGNPFVGGIQLLGLLAVPVTVLYLVGFANVVNLIDGLDGLAAGVTAIAATSLFVLAAQGNRPEAAALAAALIGACLGFLRYNFHPASIFMGDSGSMLLGFTLAVISLLGIMKTTAAIALAVPLLIIGVPIFDTLLAILRRVRRGQPIHTADREHIHHRLLGRGFDQRQTVLIIYVWSGALAVGAYTVRYAPSPVRLGALVALFAVTAVMAHWLGLFEAAHGSDSDATRG